jgi:predicted PurR-regulated permease PerM
MNPNQFRLISISLFLALIFWLCYLIISPFLLHIGWAMILTVIVFPLHKRILSLIKKPTLAALTTCFIVLLIMIIPLILISIKATYEAKDLTIYLQHNIEEVDFVLLQEDIKSKLHPFIADIINQAIPDTDLKSFIVERVSKIGTYFVHQSISIGRNIILSIVHFTIVMITFFFLLRDFEKIKELISTVLPLGKSDNKKLLEELGFTLHTTVHVALIVALVQGTLGGLSFLFLGLDAPIFWGAIMTIFCLIPFMGAPVIWLPTAIFLAIQGSYIKAIILVLWGMFVIGLIDNVIRTFLIGGSTKLHPLLVFFSVLGGVFVLGPLGIFMGPVILAAGIFLLKLVKVEYMHDQ